MIVRVIMSCKWHKPINFIRKQ